MISSSRIIKATRVLGEPVTAPVEVIPNSGPSASGAGTGPFTIEAAQQAMLAEAIAHSQQLLEQARAEAAELVWAAQAQSAELTAQARQAGLEAAEAETSQMLITAQGVLDEMTAWRRSLLEGQRDFVLELVAEAARVIFGAGFALQPEALARAFTQALAEAKPLGDLRVHLHPDDATLLGPHWPEQQSARLGQKFELVPDLHIRRGGCLVQGEHGVVDARIETQLQTAMEALHGVEPNTSQP